MQAAVGFGAARHRALQTFEQWALTIPRLRAVLEVDSVAVDSVELGSVAEVAAAAVAADSVAVVAAVVEA